MAMPPGPIAACVSARVAGSRPTTATRAPRRANSSAAARPIPLLPPVISTRLPWNSSVIAVTPGSYNPRTHQGASMNGSNTVAGERYRVVVNDEEQYSIWPEGKDLPLGWQAEGMAGSKEECLAHIEKVWTDMRPKSLRDRLAAGLPDAIDDPVLDGEPDDALVQRLATGSHPVVVAGVGDRGGAEAIERFRHRMERGHVNVLFTGTRG